MEPRVEPAVAALASTGASGHGRGGYHPVRRGGGLKT